MPTVLSPSPLQQRIAEQIVDIPVPRGRGCRRQGFSLNRILQRQFLSRLLTFQFRDMVSLAVDVFKVFTQDRIQQHLWPNRLWTLQFVVVEFLEVFKVFLWSRSSTLQFPVHVFMVYAQTWVQQRLGKQKITFFPRTGSSTKILSRDRVQLVLAVMKTLLEVFKFLSRDRVQQRLAEMVVVMLTLWLNGPRSSCGCGRTVLFSWCCPSGIR